MPEITVQLADRSYQICINQGLLGQLGARIRDAAPSPAAAVVSDENVAPLYGDRAIASLRQAGYRADIIVVPPGESSKSLEVAATLYDRLLRMGLERSSPIVALGGGVVGDLTGFVASTLYRGVPFIQIPTTLAADVDAGVGGKTGVNHPRGKNLVGTFYQPRVVLIDTDTLTTLDPRDLRAGLTESIKHAVIRDADFFTWHEGRIDQILAAEPDTMAELVRRNCEIKAAVVAEDERENGIRAILNYGHTIGHAIETIADYTYRHGEAVALGIIAANQIAVARGLIDRPLADRVESLLLMSQQPTTVAPLDRDHLHELMARDKKVIQGKLKFVLPTAMGQTTMVTDVTFEEINRALDHLETPV